MRSRYAWVILGCLILAQLVMSIGAYAWGPLAPYLLKELGLSRAQVGSLTSILYLVASLAATPLGFLVDRWGARKMLILSLAVMGVAFVVMGRVDVFWLLLGLSGIAGLGYGAINQVSVKDLSAWFDTGFRATAMGVRQAGVTVGAALGAIILPAVAGTGGWHYGTVVAGGLILATAALALLVYRDVGTAGTEAAQEPAKPKPGAAEKVNVLGELKKPELMINLLVIPLLAGGQAAIGTFLIVYLQEKGLFGSEVSLGSFLTVVMVAGTIGRIGWGVISDRILGGNRIKTMIVISLTGLIGCLGMISLRPGISAAAVYGFSALLGAGFLGFHGVLFACIAELVENKYAGAVTGILISVAWAGIVIIPIVFGALADRVGYTWSWLVLVVAALVSMISYALFLTKQGRRLKPA